MSKAKILVVEDEVITAKAIVSALKNLGYDVLGYVGSGEEAIQKASEDSPDLILMDIVLYGEMDGIEATAQIKDRFNIPVVYLTAHSDDSTLEMAKITEPYGYIIKPFEDRELLVAIEIALYKHKMEETLIQNEKFKSLGIITTGISHEFNNILNIILGTVELLEMDYNDNSELIGELCTITRAVNNGAAITDNMLKITKPSDSTSEYVPFDLNELLEQSIEFTKPRWKNMAQANGIYYSIDRKDMENVSPLLCDPTEIREVFINIINNALDAMPDGGSISFCSWSSADTLFVSISDTGKGMSKEVKSHIFDPFFTTRCPEGTGLGMSIAYGIISRHGGKVGVESDLGKGSMFTLQFPTTNLKVSPTKTPDVEQKIDIKDLRILVVDDEEDVCDILDRFLSRRGHKVKTVDNGTDAINIIKVEDFDLVLSDLSMPDVNGYEVVRAINKLEIRPKIGIITGWRGGLERFDEEGSKVDFILKKPFKNAELIKHIKGVFGMDSKK